MTGESCDPKDQRGARGAAQAIKLAVGDDALADKALAYCRIAGLKDGIVVGARRTAASNIVKSNQLSAGEGCVGDGVNG